MAFAQQNELESPRNLYIDKDTTLNLFVLLRLHFWPEDRSGVNERIYKKSECSAKYWKCLLKNSSFILTYIVY